MIEHVSQTLNTENVQLIVEMAHTMAHMNGGCDQRPLLYAALAVSDLIQLHEHLSREEWNEALSAYTEQVSFAATMFIVELTEKLKDKLPPELIERCKPGNAAGMH